MVMLAPSWLLPLSGLILVHLDINGAGGVRAFCLAPSHSKLVRSPQGSTVCKQSFKRPRSASICMMAKKKRGPAGSASLEALEAQEALLFGDENPVEPPPVNKKAKKDKKDKKAAPAANAMAELAMAMADGEDIDFTGAGGDVNGSAADASKSAAKGGNSKGGAKAARANALKGLDLFDDDEPTGTTTAAAAAVEGSKKKDKKGAKKGVAVVAVTDDADTVSDSEQSDADADTSASNDADADTAYDSDAESDPNKETLEDKIRKARPPPRVRITESAQPGYVSMRLEGIAVTFRNQEVLTDATWGVQTGDRIGLVGPNGGGKTTQMKILAGELEPTAGEVVLSAKSLRVAFLKQEFVDELVAERSLKNELLSVFTEESAILQGLEDVEADMGKTDVQNDPDLMEDAINRLSQLQEDAQRLKVYDLGTKVEKIMDMMGFMPSEGAQPVSSFSGGWRMRIGLGKILLQDPNILLLDEPTNHLDLESVEWLENFLQNQNLPMVIVSHDREFLDRVCTKIVDTDGGVATVYDGNYSRFLKLKKARIDAMESAWATQQKKIAEEKAWVNKFKNKGSFGSQIKSREKAMERMTKGPDAIKKPPRPGKPFVFRFPPAPRASEEVVSVEGLTHSYNTVKPLFTDAQLVADRGQRIAFLGPNGAGKSTLLRLIMGLEQPSHGGHARFGPSVMANYFQQNQADALDLDKTVLQVVEDASSGQSYNELRKLLGQFLFKGDQVQKKIRNLSGGEKARVSLCMFMLKPANLLVLDEPTNHLDIPAKEMLEEALQHFDGAVLVVSHDRYFISQVANTICTLEDGQLVRYEGDYRYYMEQNSQLKDKITSRYVEGVNGIQSAKVVDLAELQRVKRNFGGKGGPSGDKTKGIKNAKRMK